MIQMLIDLIKKKKAQRRQYPGETMTGADYADDLVLLAKTHIQAKSQLYSLEPVVGGSKTELRF